MGMLQGWCYLGVASCRLGLAAAPPIVFEASCAKASELSFSKKEIETAELCATLWNCPDFEVGRIGVLNYATWHDLALPAEP